MSLDKVIRRSLLELLKMFIDRKVDGHYFVSHYFKLADYIRDNINETHPSDKEEEIIAKLFSDSDAFGNPALMRIGKDVSEEKLREKVLSAFKELEACKNE